LELKIKVAMALNAGGEEGGANELGSTGSLVVCAK